MPNPLVALGGYINCGSAYGAHQARKGAKRKPKQPTELLH